MKLSDDEIRELEDLLYHNDIEDSRESLLKFTDTTFKKFEPAWFHITFYDILFRFAKKVIKNLIITMPPQHGKSEGSTRRLPAYIVGDRPDDKLAIVSYAATKAYKFGREIMTIMREQSYKDIFPDVEYPERGYTGAKSNTNETRESINSDGSMKFVGVDGPLTGDTIDVLIYDDLYKGWKDANSPVTQEHVWEWHLAVGDTRLHNDSQHLITFTRWSDEDVIGRLIRLGKVVQWDGSKELDEVIAELKHDQYLLINFEALKTGEPDKSDARKPGQALWPKRHSRAKLKSTRDKSPDMFECLHQGNPVNKAGLLYNSKFKTYDKLPPLKEIKNYTDTADSGDNYLCSVTYGVPLAASDPHYYVIDVIYTQKGMEVTEPLTANMISRNKVNKTRIESNNGGKGFYRNVKKLVDKAFREGVGWFHQSNNKEARIISESANVNSLIVMPESWHIRWPSFYDHLTKFKKLFKLNKFDDVPDTLTGIVETELSGAVTHETKIDKNIDLF